MVYITKLSSIIFTILEVPEREVQGENSDWSSASKFSLSKTISGLYCLILISIYISGTIQSMVFNSEWVKGDVSLRDSEKGDNALHITLIEVRDKYIILIMKPFVSRKKYSTCICILALVCSFSTSFAAHTDQKLHLSMRSLMEMPLSGLVPSSLVLDPSSTMHWNVFRMSS